MTKKKEAGSKQSDRFAGYERVSDDELVKPAGYWQPEHGAIHGKLVGAYEYRQKTGRSKGQLRLVYLFDLADPCPATVVSENGSGKREVSDGELKPRELCGVFATHGMRALKNRAGSFVRMSRRPEKQMLPNGNEMWVYDIEARGPKAPLLIREALDTSAERNAGRSDADETDVDDLPF